MDSNKRTAPQKIGVGRDADQKSGFSATGIGSASPEEIHIEERWAIWDDGKALKITVVVQAAVVRHDKFPAPATAHDRRLRRGEPARCTSYLKRISVSLAFSLEAMA